MTTVSDGTRTIAPDLWVSAGNTRESNNRVHRLMSGRIAVTLARVSPARGTLGLLFDSGEAAAACVDMHTEGALFLLEDQEAAARFAYVLAEGGRIEIEPMPDHETVFMVRIDYQEVTQ